MFGSEDTEAARGVVFTLKAICASVTGEQLLADDSCAALVVDYGCWELHLRDWDSRRPFAWRRRRYHDWLDEGAELTRRRGEISARARDRGLVH